MEHQNDEKLASEQRNILLHLKKHIFWKYVIVQSRLLWRHIRGTVFCGTLNTHIHICFENVGFWGFNFSSVNRKIYETWFELNDNVEIVFQASYFNNISLSRFHCNTPPYKRFQLKLMGHQCSFLHSNSKKIIKCMKYTIF